MSTKTKKKYTDAEKLQILIERLDINYSKLAKKAGYGVNSRSAVYHVKEGRNQMSENMIMGIINAYPRVNYLFLKNGELPVLINDKEVQNQSNLLSQESKEAYEKIMEQEKETFILKQMVRLLAEIKGIIKESNDTLKEIKEEITTRD